jgi:hypothetical protein
VDRRTERVGVVVVTYNSADVLPGLLSSLPAGLSGVDWRLVVVDNGSADRSVEIVCEMAPEAVCIETGRNGGYAAGFNIGAAAVPEATAVMVLNADVRLGPGCVQELLRALREPGTGIAVPKLVDSTGKLRLSMRREPKVSREILETLVGGPRLGRLWDVGVMVADHERYAVETTTDWAEGSTQLLSRECLDACGEWDESFFPLLGGDRVRAAGQGPGVCDALRAHRARHPPRGRFGRRPGQVGASVPQQGSPLPPAQRRGPLSRVLPVHRGSRGLSSGHRSGDQPRRPSGPGQPSSAAHAGRSGVAHDGGEPAVS